MMHNFIVYFRKGGDFLNIIEQNDLVNKLLSFTVEPGPTSSRANRVLFLKRLILGVICGDLCKASQPGSRNQALSQILRPPLDFTDFSKSPSTHTKFQRPLPSSTSSYPKTFHNYHLFQHTVTSLSLHNRISNSTITSLQHLKSLLSPQMIIFCYFIFNSTRKQFH